MPFFEANGITFHFADDNNDRLPFVFQHGLGADISQPMSFFGEDRPFRLISMDCRGHGKTVPLGDPQFLRFNSLTDDITNLLDYLNLSKVVIGGISMGAGVALNFAVRHPERTRALILSRASWLSWTATRTIGPDTRGAMPTIFALTWLSRVQGFSTYRW
jgi:pimeloyl-ACP methyl ester carboxylesterase